MPACLPSYPKCSTFSRDLVCHPPRALTSTMRAIAIHACRFDTRNDVKLTFSFLLWHRVFTLLHFTSGFFPICLPMSDFLHHHLPYLLDYGAMQFHNKSLTERKQTWSGLDEMQRLNLLSKRFRAVFVCWRSRAQPNALCVEPVTQMSTERVCVWIYVCPENMCNKMKTTLMWWQTDNAMEITHSRKGNQTVWSLVWRWQREAMLLRRKRTRERENR